MGARFRQIAFVMLIALLGQGCAAVGLTLFGVGAGVTAGTGTSYTLDGIAYRDRKSTRLNSSHIQKSRMPSSA